jgi:hypothetical protein
MNKEETMDQFFAIFDGNTRQFKQFIVSMGAISEGESTFSSHQRELLRFLKVASQNRSREYENLAAECNSL